MIILTGRAWGGLGRLVLKILIVEDNSSFRRALAEMLSELFPHACIAEAGSAEQGYGCAMAQDAGLALIDIKLPGQNGLKLTATLKSERSDLAIIIMTSYDLPEYQEAALALGADAFVIKDTLTRQGLRSLILSVMDAYPAQNLELSG